MEGFDSFLKSLHKIKPTLFLTVVVFIVGMIVPGACGLAIYNIDFFKEIDMLRLLLISIGICSPSLLFSFLINFSSTTGSSRPDLIEHIFLLSGFTSIIYLITIVSTHYLFNIKIEKMYIWIVILSFFCFLCKVSIKIKKHEKNQNNNIQTHNISSSD
ncbi:MAG TPA: hypothetical protein GX707_15775 [Epulopiscium sp.]|nr:hypothetical protein [Candidatus Epulonipiscium sp.]